MESALIISSTEKGMTFLSDMLNAAFVTQVSVSRSGGEARRLLLERDFDLIVINAPLRDETGEKLSRDIAAKGISQVILTVGNEFFDAVSAVCERDGVLVISKPVNKTVFWSALMLAKSAQSRLKRVQNENEKLLQKIEDIRIIERAKLCLVTRMGMSEKEAHRYIEKQAMDTRMTKRKVAEEILSAHEGA